MAAALTGDSILLWDLSKNMSACNPIKIIELSEAPLGGVFLMDNHLFFCKNKSDNLLIFSTTYSLFVYNLSTDTLQKKSTLNNILKHPLVYFYQQKLYLISVQNKAIVLNHVDNSLSQVLDSSNSDVTCHAIYQTPNEEEKIYLAYGMGDGNLIIILPHLANQKITINVSNGSIYCCALFTEDGNLKIVVGICRYIFPDPNTNKSLKKRIIEIFDIKGSRLKSWNVYYTPENIVVDEQSKKFHIVTDNRSYFCIPFGIPTLAHLCKTVIAKQS